MGRAQAHYCGWAQAVEWSQHLGHRQFRSRLKSDTLEIVQASGVVLFQNTHSLAPLGSETWTTAFWVHSLLQRAALTSATVTPTNSHWQHRLCFLRCRTLWAARDAKCWNGTSRTPGRFPTELIIHSGCSASLTDQPAFSTEINWGNREAQREQVGL